MTTAFGTLTIAGQPLLYVMQVAAMGTALTPHVQAFDWKMAGRRERMNNISKTENQVNLVLSIEPHMSWFLI